MSWSSTAWLSAGEASSTPALARQWMERLLTLRVRWRGWWLLGGYGLLPAIAVFDWVFPPEISLFAFYSIPLLIIAVASTSWWPPYLLAATAAVLTQAAVQQDVIQMGPAAHVSVSGFFAWGVASHFATYALEAALTRGLLVVSLTLHGMERQARDAFHATLEMAEALVLAPAEGSSTATSTSETGTEMPRAPRRLAELTQRVLSCRRVSIDVVDPDTALLHPIAVAGRTLNDEHVWHTRAAYSLGSGSAGLLASLSARLQAAEVLVLDAADLVSSHPWQPSTSDRIVIAPMCIRGQLVGLVIIDDDRSNDPPNDELALLGAVAQFAAIVVERERLLLAQADAVRLAERDSARTEFIAAVSHDLQTPLTSIRAGLDLLEAAVGEILAPEERDLLQAVRRNAARLGLRVHALLTANQLDAGALHLDCRPLDLRSTTMAAVTTVRPLLMEKRQTLDVELPWALPVMGDVQRLEEVIVNLLANAHRHTPTGTHVVVDGWVEDSDVHLRISDNGPGIPDEDLGVIFVRFHRRDPAGSGSGLGLAIARSIVTLHGGRLWAESQIGLSTVFHLTLPEAAEGES